ncbi:MAG: membrane dipeptidase, partial [Deltaproteobacteria bacterium]|nr:membrane dipeptidase [Deltaproteobacteria bacterium]
AHASRRTFREALEVHDRSLPPIVTHTGVEGVKPHWRNLDDGQIRAIAERGGVVGVLLHEAFLGPGGVEAVAAHLTHLLRVGGAGVPALGTDHDGAILPPRDLRSSATLPRITDALLRRGWSPYLVRGALGGNFLRALGELRG